jgi:hypothetical protein
MCSSKQVATFAAASPAAQITDGWGLLQQQHQQHHHLIQQQ